MNIIKLQNELKGVPDDALIGYVQNPTGNVPSYLALSELQRRKDMRAKYQTQQAPETSVAEDLGQQAQPQPQGIAAMPPQQAPVAEQGVAGLPIPDQMFSGQGMAAGGIVAFEDGGEVPSYAGPDGSYVNPSLYGGEVKEYKNPYKSMKLFGEEYNVYGEGLLGPNPDQDTIRAFENQRSMNPFISGMPRTDLADEYARLRLKASKNQATQQDYDRMNAINESMRPAENYPTGGGPDSPTSIAALKQSADKAAMDKQRDLAKEKEKAIKDIYAPKGGTRESVKSLSDYAKEFRDVVGTDPMQAKLAERMEKMDARSQRMEDRAPGMAMLEAGLNIASGTSPFALVNIGKGALAGVKSYGDAQDKMAALEEKRFTLVNDMAKAQRAEQLAIASKGADSRDAQLARDTQERIADKKMANDMQMQLLDNIYDLRGKEITAAQKDQPDATARATKIWPLVPEQPEYKEKMKALLETLGPEASTKGTRNYNKFVEGRQAIENEVYNNLVRKPGMGTTGATYNYVPGKGIMPL
jgi:hypothetical protein